MSCINFLSAGFEEEEDDTMPVPSDELMAELTGMYQVRRPASIESCGSCEAAGELEEVASAKSQDDSEDASHSVGSEDVSDSVGSEDVGAALEYVEELLQELEDVSLTEITNKFCLDLACTFSLFQRATNLIDACSHRTVSVSGRPSMGNAYVNICMLA